MTKYAFFRTYVGIPVFWGLHYFFCGACIYTVLTNSWSWTWHIWHRNCHRPCSTKRSMCHHPHIVSLKHQPVYTPDREENKSYLLTPTNITSQITSVIHRVIHNNDNNFWSIEFGGKKINNVREQRQRIWNR